VVKILSLSSRALVFGRHLAASETFKLAAAFTSWSRARLVRAVSPRILDTAIGAVRLPFRLGSPATGSDLASCRTVVTEAPAGLPAQGVMAMSPHEVPSASRSQVGESTPKTITFGGVVAIDGPSGTGKSTVARRLAIRLGARYLDTGAMYRAATLAVLRCGVDVDDIPAIVKTVTNSRIDISTNPELPSVTLDAAPVDAEIRSAAVTAAVSAVSAISDVRQALVAAQRELIGAGGIVVEGRDIGSVVYPGAHPKIYLTATPQARAARRAGELQGTGGVQGTSGGIEPPASADVAAVAADIERRDRLDSSRAVSPLTRAEDAIDLDTTDLGIDEVVERLVDIALSRANDA
jgi:cytidylate kinase